MKYKIILKYLSIIAIILYSCSNKSNNPTILNQADTVQTDYNRIVFETDSIDAKKIGFKEIIFRKEDPIKKSYFGVNSILLVDDYIYLTDECHGNVKQINLKTSKVDTSEVFLFPGYKSRLRNIVYFSNKLFVLSGAIENYILTKKLQLIDSFKLKAGNKRATKVIDDSLLIYSPRYIYCIDSLGNILYEKKNKHERYLSYNRVHNKEYKIIDELNYSIVKTQYGTVKLRNLFSYTADYYTSKNLDFDDKKLVYFEVNPDSLILHIYRYKN